MFETVAIDAVKRSRRFPIGFPLSIGLHMVAAAAALASVIWNVSFPVHSPRFSANYILESVPEPPPPPPPPPPPAAAQEPETSVVQADQVVTEQVFAPTEIPETIPILHQTLASVAPVTGGVVGGIEGGTIGGVIGGTPEGSPLGEPGGTKGGVVGGIIGDGRIHVERDKPLPLTPISQSYPVYPEEGRLKNWEDSCVVRYVIAKDGHVSEVILLSHSQHKCFDAATITAISHWRFRPLVKDGEAVEVVHELTVNFRLVAV